jgi:hypothetical protein
LHIAIGAGELSLAQAASAQLATLVGAEIDADLGGAMLVPRADALLLGLVATREGWEAQRAALQPRLSLEGRWRGYPLLQALQQLISGWEALRAGHPEQALLAVDASRQRVPLFLAHELELEARLARGEAIGDRAAALAKRLHEGLGEAYNYFSLQLPNLMFWRRLRSWV